MAEEQQVAEAPVETGQAPSEDWKASLPEDIRDNQVFIKSADDGEIKCFYTIYGERKDIEKLEVEF